MEDEEHVCEHEERGRYAMSTLASTCERRPDSNGDWICDRCGSLWGEMLMGLGWLPLSCVDRRDDIK